MRSGKYEAAPGHGKRAPQLLCGVNPLANNDLYVCQCRWVGLPIGRAARKLRDFGDEGWIFVAPVDYDLMFKDPILQANDISA